MVAASARSLWQTACIDGTKIILETTAKEFGNDVNKPWRSAEAGESEFLPIFLPWSIEPSYRTRLPDDFTMTSEEKKLAELHRLDAEQIHWRRRKIGELRSEDLFKRECPLTPDEAFMGSSFDSFITNDLVMKARREEIEPYGPLIVGADPVGKGADSTAIAWRRGHCIVKTERRRGLDTMEVAGWVAQISREDKPAKANVDVGGLDIGVYDRLIEQGHDSGVVTAVNFGGKPIEPPPPDEAGKPGGRPANRRAELWSRLWLQ